MYVKTVGLILCEVCVCPLPIPFLGKTQLDSNFENNESFAAPHSHKANAARAETFSATRNGVLSELQERLPGKIWVLTAQWILTRFSRRIRS